MADAQVNVPEQENVPELPKEDKISVLPYVLLVHILSLLPRKDAIRTGVLSTTWKDLWKARFSHQAMLNFGRWFQSDDDQAQIASEIEQHMSRHKHRKIDTFKLYFNPGDTYKELTAGWIRQAVVNGVEEFYLNFSQGILGNDPTGRLLGKRKRFEMKYDIFESNNTLTILSLSYCNLPRSFEFGHVRFLETVYLHGINLSDSMFNKLMNNCTRLKVMDLRECIALHCIKIRHDGLQKLSIASCLHLKEIYIFAPLCSFHLYGEIPKKFYMHTNVSLLRSVIMTTNIKKYYENPNRSSSMDVVFDHVQVLTLCSAALQSMFESRTSSRFACQNVSKLHLRILWLTERNLKNINRLFAQCQFPLLERLFLELTAASGEHSMRPALLDQPRFVLPCLRQIKIMASKCNSKEIQLLDLLVRAAVNLERIILVFSDMNAHSLLPLRIYLLKLCPGVQVQIIDPFQVDLSIEPMHAEVIRGLPARVPQLNGPRE